MADDLSIQIDLNAAGDAAAQLATAAANAELLAKGYQDAVRAAMDLQNIASSGAAPGGMGYPGAGGSAWPGGAAGYAPPPPMPPLIAPPVPPPAPPGWSFDPSSGSFTPDAGSGDDMGYGDTSGMQMPSIMGMLHKVRGLTRTLHAPMMIAHMASQAVDQVTAGINQLDNPMNADMSAAGVAQQMNSSVPLIGGLLTSFQKLSDAVDGTTSSMAAFKEVSTQMVQEQSVVFKSNEQLANLDVTTAGQLAKLGVEASPYALAGLPSTPGQSFAQNFQQMESQRQLQAQGHAAAAGAAKTDAELTQLSINQAQLQLGELVDPAAFDLRVKQMKADAAVQSVLGLGQSGLAKAGGLAETYSTGGLVGVISNLTGGPQMGTTMQKDVLALATAKAQADAQAAAAATLAGSSGLVNIDDQIAKLQQTAILNMGAGGNNIALDAATKELEVLHAQKGLSLDAQLANAQKVEALLPGYQAGLQAQAAADPFGQGGLKQDLSQAQSLLGQVTATTTAFGGADEGTQASAAQAFAMLRDYGPQSLSQDDQALIKQFGGSNLLAVAQQGLAAQDTSGNLAFIQGQIGQGDGSSITSVAQQQSVVLDLKDKLDLIVQLDNETISVLVSDKLKENVKEITRLTQAKMQDTVDKVKDAQREGHKQK